MQTRNSLIFADLACQVHYKQVIYQRESFWPASNHNSALRSYPLIAKNILNRLEQVANTFFNQSIINQLQLLLWKQFFEVEKFWTSKVMDLVRSLLLPT